MLIAAFVLAACSIVLVMSFRVLRDERSVEELEPEPFRFEDAYNQMPEFRLARSRAMAVPRKHPVVRSRNSR